MMDEKERSRLLKHANKCGFARIKGIGGLSSVDHVMKTYRITLGRPNKKAEVDVSLGETMSVSRQHGEIYYDFDKKGFYLKVLGKNGIHVDGKLVQPKDASGGVVELSSKSCLQVTTGGGENEDRVFFLLPKRKKRVLAAAAVKKEDDVEARAETVSPDGGAKKARV